MSSAAVPAGLANLQVGCPLEKSLHAIQLVLSSQLAAQFKEAAFLPVSGCGPGTTETSGPEVNVPPPPSRHRPERKASCSLPPPPRTSKPVVFNHTPCASGISEPTSSGQAIGPEQRWGGTCWSTPVRGAQCAEVRAPECLRRDAPGWPSLGLVRCPGEGVCVCVGATARHAGRGRARQSKPPCARAPHLADRLPVRALFCAARGPAHAFPQPLEAQGCSPHLACTPLCCCCVCCCAQVVQVGTTVALLLLHLPDPPASMAPCCCCCCSRCCLRLPLLVSATAPHS